MSRCAVLDLGSNSFHLLVADIDGSTVHPVRRQREMLHLGRAIARHGSIPVDLGVRAVATVERLAELARRSGAEEVVAVGTEALRRSGDGDLVARLSEAAGAPLALLDGEEEARLAYLGARAGVDVIDEPTLVLDLGGGSLELAIGSGERILWAMSLPLGASRLSAMLDPDGGSATSVGDPDADAPPSPRALKRLRQHVITELADAATVVRRHAPASTIAVGGTVRALAQVLADRAGRWLPATVNQAPLDRDELAEVAVELSAVSTTERARIPGVKSRRADHLHVAAIVLDEVLRRTAGPDGRTVRVSDWGLREGVLLHRFGRVRVPEGSDLRAGQVAWLRRTFSGEDPHPEHVATLAERLFDATATLHGHDARSRELLGHAARLHAIGTALALRRQQEHGAYLLEHAELRGFDPEELAVILTLVRFHPSRGISRRFAPYVSLDDAARERTADLLALLQVADALDVTHDQHAVLTGARRSRGALELELTAAPPAITERAVRDRSSLLTERFGLPVRLRARPAA
jgi:exopolyphosphatase / guanosine-5'-triphosphate,3'-diphosphate pyrophosphatase